MPEEAGQHALWPIATPKAGGGGTEKSNGNGPFNLFELWRKPTCCVPDSAKFSEYLDLLYPPSIPRLVGVPDEHFTNLPQGDG